MQATDALVMRTGRSGRLRPSPQTPPAPLVEVPARHPEPAGEPAPTREWIAAVAIIAVILTLAALSLIFGAKL